MEAWDTFERKFMNYPQSVVGKEISVKSVASPGNLWWKDCTFEQCNWIDLIWIGHLTMELDKSLKNI